MKILHLADLHLHHGWFDWISAKSRGYDLIVIAGDIQDAFSNAGMHQQARAAAKWLLSIKTPTVICSGNHDFWKSDHMSSVDTQAEAAWIKNLRGSGAIIGVDGDIVDFNGFSICVNGWLQRPVSRRFDIVVTHAPPSGCVCARSYGTDHGDSALSAPLSAHPPALMLCGHIHKPEKLSCHWDELNPFTAILVPGCDDQMSAPAHWSINTDASVALHSNGEVRSLAWHRVVSQQRQSPCLPLLADVTPA